MDLYHQIMLAVAAAFGCLALGAVYPTWGLPGISATVESTERQVYWEHQGNIWVGGQLVSTTTDSGASPTTSIRAGLIVALKSDGLLYAYDPTATDGKEVPYGVLTESGSMLDPQSSVVANKAVRVLVAGFLRAANLTNVDAQARAIMTQSGRFIFDDDIVGKGSLFGPFARVQSKAADYTVTAADTGSLFITTAAANYTLPTKAAGLAFEFLQTADANMAILSAGSADDIIVDGDAGADSVTYSTASHKIGSRILVQCVNVGGALKWITSNLGGTTQTIA